MTRLIRFTSPSAKFLANLYNAGPLLLSSHKEVRVAKNRLVKYVFAYEKYTPLRNSHQCQTVNFVRSDMNLNIVL